MQYLKNFQFIQNHMGQFADGYDEIKAQKRLLDWSNEGETLKIVQMLVTSCFATILFVGLVPVKLVMLVGGVWLFLQNTAWVRGVNSTLMPLAIRFFQRNLLEQVQEAMKVAKRKVNGIATMACPPSTTANLNSSPSTNNIAGGSLSLSPSSKTATTTTSNTTITSSSAVAPGPVKVVVFENQRWWAGLGWINHLLRSERSAWSDEHGTIAYPKKEEYNLPLAKEEWEWAVGEVWNIDFSWNEACDEEGWVFSDHSKCVCV